MKIKNNGIIIEMSREEANDLLEELRHVPTKYGCPVSITCGVLERALKDNNSPRIKV
jgi:hypothetical protein